VAEFVHLHVHTQYSMLDGALKLKDLAKKTAALGMNAVGMTDHGNMFGTVSFYKAAKEAGIQPILGAELEVDSHNAGCHLPLLAESVQGYQNLVWLTSRSHVRAHAGEPAILKLEDFEGRTDGLIALTGCMGGLVSNRILEEGEAAGEAMLARLAALFPKGNLYVELQDHGLPEQSILNSLLCGSAARLGLPLVASNDVHFGAREDANAHMYLACIKSGRSVAEARERHHGSSEMYLKSPAEMVHLFRDTPAAIASTLEIRERTKVKLKLGEPMLPTFPVPDGYDTESYFRHVAREGLEARLTELRAFGGNPDADVYRNRLAMELDVIAKMKFPGYFLIVWDFIRYAKENGIPVGPGRGSGAGSIVAYSMRITDLDPIPYNLLFERFLNPERVSMPDFDIDFCMDKRDAVIRYVQKKYGENSVGQIATFAELKAKSVIKDVARALSITPFDAQQVANLIPRKNPAETYTIAESLELEPKLKARAAQDPQIRELLLQAQKLEGLTRHAGKHAAGIVISEGPLWDHVPVFKDDKGDGFVTQYYKDDVEQAGLVKFDFLGLKTLTVIDIAQRIINERPDLQREGRKIDVSRIPLDDSATFALLGSGETKGVFQLESSGMQQLFKDLKADCFEDIVAAVALYRPGPLGSGMVGDFVNRKNGRAPIAKMHPLVDHILVPTYGVIVYQEQVMQVAQELAGYTLGGADLLRRAMGKKKPEEMAKQKSTFVDGAKAKVVAEADADQIFGLLEYFAGYGFNKSHSAAYALITYQTAYLKAHYPVELLCGILTSDKDKVEKVVRTVADARSMGIQSNLDFKVVYTHPDGTRKGSRRERVKDPLGPQIRFGLGAVRGLGEAALETLLESRTSSGSFHDLFDFASRVDAKRVNKGVFEALVQCGAFDSTLMPRGISRARAFAAIEVALERSRAASRDRERGQANLFGLFDAGGGGADASLGEYPQCPPWDRREALVREQRALGFYVSGHPLDRYLRGERALAKLGAEPTFGMAQKPDWSLVKLVGCVEGYRERVFKDGGGKIAFFELEDLVGRVNVKVRGSAIDTFSGVLTRGEPVVVTGKVSFPHRDAEDGEEDGPREPTILLSDVVPLIDAIKSDATALTIKLSAALLARKQIEDVRDLLQQVPGSCPVTLQIELEDGAEATLALPPDLRIEVNDAVFSGLEKIFGEQVAELR
jgi:DNA polymerase III subunit alpha